MSAETTAQPATAEPLAPTLRGERIHFSRSPGRASKLAKQGAQMRDSIVFVFTLLGVLAFVGTQRALSGIRIEALALIAAGIGLPFAARGWTWVRWRSRTADLHRHSDPSCRLCVIGHPNDLLVHGPLDDFPFEPAVFRSFATVGTTVQWITAIPIVVMAIAGLAYPRLFTAMLPLLPGSSHIGIVIYGAGFVVVAAIAVAWFWPRYYRVLPGRLDIMDYRPLARRGRLIRSIDLRSAKLLINLRFWTVRIETDGESEEFLFRFMPDRRRFAHTLLLAAVSTAPAPPLPDDELIG